MSGKIDVPSPCEMPGEHTYLEFSHPAESKTRIFIGELRLSTHLARRLMAEMGFESLALTPRGSIGLNKHQMC